MFVTPQEHASQKLQQLLDIYLVKLQFNAPVHKPCFKVPY